MQCKIQELTKIKEQKEIKCQKNEDSSSGKRLPFAGDYGFETQHYPSSIPTPKRRRRTQDIKNNIEQRLRKFLN